jgi:hypothetical protein
MTIIMKGNKTALETNPNANHRKVIIIHPEEREICCLKVGTREWATSITNLKNMEKYNLSNGMKLQSQ